MTPRLSGRDIYLVGLFFLFLSFRRRLRLRRGPGNDCRPCLGPVALKGAGPRCTYVVRRYLASCLGTAALKGAVPRSSAWCNGTPRGRKRSRKSASRLYHRSFPADHAPTHNEHPPRLVEHSLRSRPIAATVVTLLRRPWQDLGAHKTQKMMRESCEARRPSPRKEMQDGWKFFVVAPPLFSGWQPQSRRQGPQCSHC